MTTVVSRRRKPAAMDWIAFAFLLVVSAANIFLLVHFIPLFQQIYHDMQGVEPLPSATASLIYWRGLVGFFALIWPAAGIFLVCSRRNKNTMRFVLGLILAAVLQAGFTTILLFMPLITDIRGNSTQLANALKPLSTSIQARMITLIEQIWRRLTAEEFSKQRFIESLRKDGGIDIRNLSDHDLLSLLEERFSGDWAEPAFAFSEMLAMYCGLEGDLEPRQIAGWAFASIIMGQAFRRGHGDICIGFNIFVRGYTNIQTKLEVEESVVIFHHFICGGLPPLPA